MANTIVNRTEPFASSFSTPTRKLTGADSPTGSDVELQQIVPYGIGGGLIGFVTGGRTTPASPTYNAGELLCDPIDITSVDGFIGDGKRLMRIEAIKVVDPSYTLDDNNFAIFDGVTFGSAGTPAVVPYAGGTALAVTPVPITWDKFDAGDPGTPTGVRYLTAHPGIVVNVGGDEALHWGLVATAAITSAFLTDDPDYGQATFAVLGQLL